MPRGKRQLFIYWRAAVADTPLALRAARDMQLHLQSGHPGLRCGLYLRSEAPAAEATLMETYAVESADAAQAVDPALQQRIETAAAAALRPWLRGVRHVEVFEACDD